jgi:hypothetical protein
LAVWIIVGEVSVVKKRPKAPKSIFKLNSTRAVKLRCRAPAVALAEAAEEMKSGYATFNCKRCVQNVRELLEVLVDEPSGAHVEAALGANFVIPQHDEACDLGAHLHYVLCPALAAHLARGKQVRRYWQRGVFIHFTQLSERGSGTADAGPI